MELPEERSWISELKMSSVDALKDALCAPPCSLCDLFTRSQRFLGLGSWVQGSRGVWGIGRVEG